MRASTCKVLQEAKRNSWLEYISKLNTTTPAKRVWEMVRKLNGKQSSTSVSHLINPDGTKISERTDIANRLAEKISQNSSNKNYTAKFKFY